METLGRWMVGLLAAAGVTVGILNVDGEWVSGFALDAFHFPGRLVAIQQETAREQDLDEQRDATSVRMVVKDQIISEVAEGRVPLRVAAGQFLEASTCCPYCWDYLAEERAEWSPKKRCACYIIDGVERQLACEGRDPTSEVARLQAELEEWQED